MVNVCWLRGGLLALFSLLAACGSGGGAAGPRVFPSGPHHLVTFKGFHGPPDNVRTHVGTSLWNGVDTMTDAGSIQNENGAISFDPGGPVIPFSLSWAGALTATSSLGEQFRGGVLKSGAMTGFASVLSFPSSEVLMALDLKKGSGLGNATLTGDYHVCTFGAQVGGAHFGVVGIATFDGIGSVDFATTLSNNDGVITGASLAVTGYNITADGTFTFGTGFQGGASADGDYAIAGGGTTAGSLNEMIVFIRRAMGGAIDNHTARGTYSIVGIGFGLADGKYYDYAGHVTIDGDNRTGFRLEISREGLVDTLIYGGLYTVAPDGVVEFTGGLGFHTYQGAISADGRLAILGGGRSAGADPTLAVLFLR